MYEIWVLWRLHLPAMMIDRRERLIQLVYYLYVTIAVKIDGTIAAIRRRLEEGHRRVSVYVFGRGALRMPRELILLYHILRHFDNVVLVVDEVGLDVRFWLVDVEGHAVRVVAVAVVVVVLTGGRGVGLLVNYLNLVLLGYDHRRRVVDFVRLGGGFLL